MSESETLSDLAVWSFKLAFNIIEEAIEQGNWDQAIAKCNQGKEEAVGLKNILWVNKFDFIKQEIIDLKKKQKGMDTTKHKVIVPRLEEKKEELEVQKIEILENIASTPEQEQAVIDDLSIIKGVGSTKELKLKESGILSIEQLATMAPEALAQIDGFGLGPSERIISAAKEYFEQQSKTHKSIKNKTSSKTPMFDPKYKIDRSSRTIMPLKKAQNISSGDVEHQGEGLLAVDRLQEVDEQTDDFVESKSVDTRKARESEGIEENSPPADFLKSSDEKNLDIITNQLETQTENKNYLNPSQIQQENKISKNEVISGFLDDGLEVPQDTTPEIQYEQIMQDIKNDFTDERLNKNTVTTMLKKAQDILKTLDYTIIPKASPVFRELDRNVDCIAVKVVQGNSDTELILIIPIKICDLKGTLLISDNGFDYHSEDNPKHQEKAKALLVRSVMKDFVAVQDKIFDSVINDKNVFRFFRNYLKDGNISIEKGRNNQALFFRSGLLQYKIIIEPILLCHSLPSSLEKNMLFPYQKSTNIHYIDYAGLSSLVTFLEHKYQSLESHCIEGNAVKIYFEAKLKFIKDLRSYSTPFVFLGLIFLLIIILQASFLINTFIGLGIAAIWVYGIIIVFLYVRFTKTKSAISKEFSNPYHKRKVAIDDMELFMISKDLSTEQMDQFIYECFGKEADFSIISKIEEDKYAHSIATQKQSHRLGKTPSIHSYMSKNTSTKDNEHSKYGSFLED